MPRTTKTHARAAATSTRTRTPRTAAKETTGTPQPASKQPASKRPGGKLLPGQLQSLVLDHVQRHPDQDWGPSQVARALDRSTGAVGNALETFADRGLLTRTSTSPRRYQAIKATAASTTRRTKSRRTSAPRATPSKTPDTTPSTRAMKGTTSSPDAGTQPQATKTPPTATGTDSPSHDDVHVTDARSSSRRGTDVS